MTRLSGPPRRVPWPITTKATALTSLGKLNDAVRCYDTAIGIDPYDAESWYNKSTTLLKLGKTNDASQCAERAIDLSMGR